MQVDWLDGLADVFPRRRDDEPPDLRARIVKELRDHLECACAGELVKCGDEDEARRRALARLGDPRRLARKLWLDAMQEKIMSQRIMLASSLVMTVACVVMGAIVWRVADQSAQASLAAVEQGRETNQALLAALSQLLPKQDKKPDNKAITAPAPEPPQPRGELRVRVVQDHPGGAPAAGLHVNFFSRSRNGFIDAGETDANGEFIRRALSPGSYYVYVTAARGESACSRDIAVDAGQAGEPTEIVWPAETFRELSVALDVDWPAEWRSENAGLLIEVTNSQREVAGTLWNTDKFDGRYIVTTDGIVLKCRIDDSYLSANLYATQAGGDIWITDLGGAPEPRVKCHCGRVEIQVYGVVALDGQLTPQAVAETGEFGVPVNAEERPDARKGLFVCESRLDTEDDKWPRFTVDIADDDQNPRIKIPISLALAANARRALVKTAMTTPRDEVDDGDLAADDAAAHVDEAETAQSLVDRARIIEDSRPQRAIALYDAAVKKDPRNHYALLCRASFRSAHGDIDKAIDDYVQVIAIDPEPQSAQIYLGQMWLQKGDREQATQVFEGIRIDLANEAGKGNGSRGLLYLERAHAWAAMGELDKALADFGDGIRLSPAYPLWYAERAEIWKRRGELDKALADFGEVIFLWPNDDKAYAGRAEIWKTRGDFDKAIQDYREAVRQSPNKPDACRALAWFLATVSDQKVRHPQQALQYAVRACQFSNWRDASCMSTLAAAYAATGDFELAAKWEVRALETMNRTKPEPAPDAIQQADARLSLYRAGQAYVE
jgi:tetratricopeptide (TPR) repeat protein